MPAVLNQGLGNSSQPLSPATKPKGRKAIYYRIDSATLHKEMKLFFPLEVDNSVEDYELFPTPWFETAGTIYHNRLQWTHKARYEKDLQVYGRAHVLKGPTAGGNDKVCLVNLLPLSIWLIFRKVWKEGPHRRNGNQGGQCPKHAVRIFNGNIERAAAPCGGVFGDQHRLLICFSSRCAW